MTIRIVPLGTNGFIPSFDRHTMSVLVLSEGDALLLDAGTGVARLLEPRIVELLEPYERLNILLSHYHLDHVVGLSYLLGAWRRGRVRIYAPGRPFVEADPEDALGQLLRPPLFPLRLRDFPVPVEVIPVTGEHLQVGALSVQLRTQKHPGGSMGIRIADTIAYATDTAVEQATAAFVHGVRLLMHEVYYADGEVEEERAAREGHSFAGEVARIAGEAGVERLMPIHHHPLRSDAELRRLAREMALRAEIEVIVPEEGRSYPVSE